MTINQWLSDEENPNSCSSELCNLLYISDVHVHLLVSLYDLAAV